MNLHEKICREAIQIAATEALLLDSNKLSPKAIDSALRTLVQDTRTIKRYKEFILSKFTLWLAARKTKFIEIGAFDAKSRCFATPQDRGQQLLNFLDEEKFDDFIHSSWR